MNKQNFVYFDTEFTGLHKNTTLISIGLILNQNKKFYAEFTDYDESQVDDWVRENVLNNLFLDSETIENTDSENITYVLGTKEEIRIKLAEWLESLGENVTLVSDAAHYDMMLFIDIFGTVFDIPKNVCPSCLDINQEIAKYLNCSIQEAFHKNREELVLDLYNCTERIKLESKHNSLYDAEIIKMIHEILEVTTSVENSNKVPAPEFIIRKSVEEFRKSGLLWLINMNLHLYGWAICADLDNDMLYPAKCSYRGFDEKSNTKGYLKVTNYLVNNAKELLKDCDVE